LKRGVGPKDRKKLGRTFGGFASGLCASPRVMDLADGFARRGGVGRGALGDGHYAAIHYARARATGKGGGLRGFVATYRKLEPEVLPTSKSYVEMYYCGILQTRA